MGPIFNLGTNEPWWYKLDFTVQNLSMNAKKYSKNELSAFEFQRKKYVTLELLEFHEFIIGTVLIEI